MKNLQLFILLLFLTFIYSYSSYSQPVIDFESGIVFTGYNDVRVPGGQGTLFSLKDDINSKTNLFYRIRASYNFKSFKNKNYFLYYKNEI